ncbi:DUF1120 domain-containing protein [Serratia fonticola]
MKTSLYILSVLSLSMFSVGAVQAADAPTAELKVVGKLGAPTCTVAITNDGIFDFGKIPVISVPLQSPATRGMGSKSETLTVSCDAETYMNMTPVDNRAASNPSSSNQTFGLGHINGTGKIGTFTATVIDAKVDDVSSQLFTSASSTFTPAATADLTKGMRTGWATTAANTQQSGKVFVATMRVVGMLYAIDIMKGRITENVPIDGSVTLNFAYGI